MDVSPPCDAVMQELAACRAELEKARSRIALLELEQEQGSAPSKTSHTAAEIAGGLLSAGPILCHDRSTPLSAAATSASLSWMRQLRSAQLKAVQGCADLQGATNRLVACGQTFASSLRDLSLLYSVADSTLQGDNAVPSTSSTSLAAGTGMLAELLTEVCGFSANLAASLGAVFVTPLGGGIGAAFTHCMSVVRAAGT